ncbi:uncharacterized protein LOC134177435 [Corticium candelabrum]|uniref:uncharacterized protein LOC134177435 n=1 Tax=Corticium candelabrum TaxID=121492 RepID=UPI002E274D52|nr:uncharacterized protein LOC134177435 [Corticium candelabrum]
MRRSAQRLKELSFLFMIIGLTTITYFVIYIRVIGTPHGIHKEKIKRLKFQRLRDRLGCISLWEQVGCRSKYSILRCARSKRSPDERHYDSFVTTFESLVYLNACRHDTCSLVGSSGNLRNHRYGKLIDASNIVIRINNPPIKGYEEYAGTRPADISIVNDHSNCFNSTTHPTLYIRSKDNALTKDQGVIGVCQAHRIASLYSLSRFIQRNYVHATSGLKALIFSMMICKQVLLFGFGMQGTNSWHYYPPYSNYTPLHHEMSLESRIIQDLANGTFGSSTADFRNEIFGKVNVTFLGY